MNGILYSYFLVTQIGLFEKTICVKLVKDVKMTSMASFLIQISGK
jgi:hypothetical protein